VGSTALDAEPDARRFMESYYAAMRGAVESHGGTVTQLLGDGVKAVFGIPRVAEDDAIRAVRAAVAMQDAFRALAEQQRGAVGKTGLRVAVNTGEVVATTRPRSSATRSMSRRACRSRAGTATSSSENRRTGSCLRS
jgi:class 3 adenylate cyclase